MAEETRKEEIRIEPTEKELYINIKLPPPKLFRCSKGHEAEIQADSFDMFLFTIGEPDPCKRIVVKSKVCPACLVEWLNQLPQLLPVEEVILYEHTS